IRHYQRSAATPRALEIMQESYIQLGLPELARDARSILQASYPDYILHRNEFYRKLASNRQGDDADTTTAEDAGLIQSLWNEITPGGAIDDNPGRAWLQGNPNENLYPTRRPGEPPDSEPAATDPAAETAETKAEAPEETGKSSPWLESRPAKN